MSYSDFLNQFVGVISLFINSLISVSESLMSNYIFITFLGITIFVSLFWFLHNIVMRFFENVVSGYEDYNDLYDDYVLKKQVQSDYLDNHYDDEYDFRYRSKLLNLQVLNGLYQTQHDLLVENRIENLQTNIDALKELKTTKLLDNDDSNDNDVDMLIPNPPVNLASVGELKSNKNSNIFDDDPHLHDRLVEENKMMRAKILLDYSHYVQKNYIPGNSDFELININSGEVIPRYIDSGDDHFDLYTSSYLSDDDFVDKAIHESELKEIDNLNGEHIGLGGF